MWNIIDKVWIVLVAIMVIVAGYAVVDSLYTVEVETYTEGYEINMMEISKHHRDCGLLCIRNDNDSATLHVSLDTYAGYGEGEVVEVEVEVREHPLSGDTYLTHRLVK